MNVERNDVINAGGSGDERPSAAERAAASGDEAPGAPPSLSTRFQQLYHDLRRRASRILNRENYRGEFQTTMLVHEGYAKMQRGAAPLFESDAQFFAAASRAMRNILVDYYRERQTKKRGGDRHCVELHESACLSLKCDPAEILAVHEVLDRLAEHDARKAQVVELRYFGGLSNFEIARILGVAVQTVERDWSYSRAWLKRELSKSAS